ncbi:hypothetical protein, partial [Pseudomonas viridiflava]|uniref:hypothetical protein n=1 Tax=Pseudomonas viridiflava TaxID=33069 RepID=UPI001980DCF4
MSVFTGWSAGCQSTFDQAASYQTTCKPLKKMDFVGGGLLRERLRRRRGGASHGLQYAVTRDKKRATHVALLLMTARSINRDGA